MIYKDFTLEKRTKAASNSWKDRFTFLSKFEQFDLHNIFMLADKRRVPILIESKQDNLDRRIGEWVNQNEAQLFKQANKITTIPQIVIISIFKSSIMTKKEPE